MQMKGYDFNRQACNTALWSELDANKVLQITGTYLPNYMLPTSEDCTLIN
jgi:hypothetical protein